MVVKQSSIHFILSILQVSSSFRLINSLKHHKTLVASLSQNHENMYGTHVTNLEKISYASYNVISDWWYTYPSEKYESQLG